MPREPRVYLEDILTACGRIRSYAGSDPRAPWDSKTFDAIVRNLEIIGEAVKRMPEEWKVAQTQVEWRKIAGLRDVLIHGYFTVNEEILRDVVVTKLPGLEEAVKAILHG